MFTDSLSRLATYYRRNGLKGTTDRIAVALRRLFGYTAVFYWDLKEPQECATARLPEYLTVECKTSRADISDDDWSAIVGYWNEKIQSKVFLDRLERGACIWLLQGGDGLAGYVWSTVGKTLDPYFFPLTRNDAYLYDFLIFPEYRGLRFIEYLVTHILQEMAKTWCTRAYVEIAEWNIASLKSSARMGYVRHQVGLAKKATLFGKTFVSWISCPLVQSR